MSPAQIEPPSRRQVCCRGKLFVSALMLVLAPNVWGVEEFTVESARAAAERGDAKALYFLGKHYARGEGVPQDYGKAAEYLRDSAEKGYAYAQNDLGAFYAKGQGVRQDYAEAARWYRKAAEKGDVLAQYSLGRSYWLGRGVTTNVQASLKWLNKSAKRNQADAMQFLGEVYLHGGPGLKADGCQAFHWFLKAAEQGRAGASYSLGQLFEEGNGAPRNLDLAINCYRQAAEKGDSQAMMRLSELYMAGSQAEELIEALKWLRLAAIHGDGYANQLMATLSFGGRFTKEQYEEACRRAGDFERAFGRTQAKQ